MLCYYQGCTQTGTTKEHIPAKAFFPIEQRNQLLTVPACAAHNNGKSEDDAYVLAQICMNTSPANGSRGIFLDRVAPQLEYNDGALRKLLAVDAKLLENGAVKYRVNIERVDNFFTALSCGIVYKSCRRSLPINYEISHIYHDFSDDNETEDEKMLRELVLRFYSESPPTILDFGQVKTMNTSIYTAKLFGMPDFRSSITLTHEFFGVFRVTSMLTRTMPT